MQGYGPPGPGGSNPYAPPQGGYGAPPGAGAYAPRSGEYEFTESENVIIQQVATRAKVWGIIQIVIAALYGLLGLIALFANPAGVAYVAVGGAFIAIGIAFVKAGGALSDVVNTQGNDIPLLMGALQSFGRALMIQIVMFCIGVAIMILALVAVFAFIGTRSHF